MKKHWNLIRLILLVVILIGLMGFANQRNEQKNLIQVGVEVFPFEEVFITEDEVQHLILPDFIENMKLKDLDLQSFENQLITHDLIKEAQVFYEINGFLGIQIVQRKPLLRFLDGGFQYLDEEGKIMPLSKNYSARVPVALGYNSTSVQTLFPLVKSIQKDEFLRQHIIGFNKDSQGVNLSLRESNFVVVFGEVNDIELKLNNLKAFYAKAKKDGNLATFKKVDLRFGNQVVCTKI